MALPGLVEYLAAQEKSPGQPLVYGAGTQIHIAAFPPLTTRVFTVSPGDGEFAYLMFKANYDIGNMALAFSLYIQHRGIRPWDGLLTQSTSMVGLDGFLWVTEAQKLMVRLTNNSNLNQVIDFGFEQMVIKTKEDFELVFRALERYGVSLETEKLLKVIAGRAI